MDIDSDSLFPRTKIGRDHQLRDAFRHGKVIERKLDEKSGKPLVRVQYLDKQGLISYWLPVKQFGSRLTSHFYCPKIGDNVNVNHLANGVENAFVDGSFFTQNDPPPKDIDIDTRHFETEDGTIIEYREKDSTFLLDASSAGSMKKPSTRAAAGGAVEVKSGTINETAAEKITVTTPIMEITATDTIILTAPVVAINGLITHTGDMTTTGVHTDANGIHGGMRKKEDDLEREIEMLKERLFYLEQQVQMRLPLR